eukprot:g14544.t1
MGTVPRDLETKHRKEFLKLIAPAFEWTAGGESFSDLYIRRRSRKRPAANSEAILSEEDSDGGGPVLWTPLQLKTAGARTAPWARKMRFNLKKQRTSLHGALYVGYCSEDPSSILVEQVHRCRDYSKYDPNAASSNIDLENLHDALAQFCETSVAARLEGGEAGADAMMAYSKETLEEKRARAFFNAALRTLGNGKCQYKSATPEQEYSCVDGLLSIAGPTPPPSSDSLASLMLESEGAGGLFSSSSPSSTDSSASGSAVSESDEGGGSTKPKSIRIQEKVLTIRKERGSEFGLRCPMRRSSGKPYKAGDADYLLLHARADAAQVAESDQVVPTSANSVTLHGSALIPWRVLIEEGIVAGEDETLQPGKTYLSIFPQGAPGVPERRARLDGVLEQYYVPYDEDFCNRLAAIVQQEAEVVEEAQHEEHLANGLEQSAEGNEDDLLADE